MKYIHFYYKLNPMFIGRSFCLKWLFQNQVQVLKIYYAELNTVYFNFSYFGKNGTEDKMKKKFISSVFYPLSILYLWCNIFAKKKTISAFIFHFKQLEYLQAVQNNKHSDTHTHTLTDTLEYIYSYLWFILNAGRGNE